MALTKTQQNYKNSFLQAAAGGARVRAFIGAFEQCQPESYFFTKDTLSFFGDTISNYSIPKKPVKVLVSEWKSHLQRDEEKEVLVYALRRKKAVKGGLTSSAYFDAENLKHLVNVKEEL